MLKMVRFSLALALTSALVSTPSASASELQAADAVQSFGATSYNINLEEDIKKVEVLDTAGGLFASLEISFDGRDGALLDLKTVDGTHLSVLWGDPEDGVAVTDLLTGEAVILDAEWGESNQGEGIALIENHREALTFLGELYADLDLKVFEGELVVHPEAPSAGLGLGSISQGIFNGDPPCNGPQQLGHGTSFTANVTLANQRAIQDANNKCTNQWCWGCCDFTRPSICRTVLFVTTCTAYGKRCGQPCV